MPHAGKIDRSPEPGKSTTERCGRYVVNRIAIYLNSLFVQDNLAQFIYNLKLLDGILGKAGPLPNNEGENKAVMGISVAMCTYNGERYLGEQLQSIAAQSLRPFELVVCDDGSTDSTVPTLESFGQRAPFDVRIIRNETNLGVTQNFEKAIKLCTGEFIALSDQDDVWLPDKLTRLSELLAQDSSLGGAFSNAELIGEDSQPSGKLLWSTLCWTFRDQRDFERIAAIKLLLHGVVATGSMLMIRAAVREAICPIPRSWMHDAWITWMLVLYSRLSFVSEPLVQYRIHPNQQIGICSLTPYEQFQRRRRESTDKFDAWSKQFEELRNRWIIQPGEDFEKCLAMIEGRITFLRHRARLPRNPLVRACKVLASASSYRCYANGFRSMLRDTLIPVRHKPGERA